MSSLSWLPGFLAIVLLVTGAHSIEVGFYAENGGESVGISDYYDVSEGISIYEEAEAQFDELKMIESREVAGSGDADMQQTFTGSGGYIGRSNIWSQDASHVIFSSAVLTPDNLNAKLSGSIVRYSGTVGEFIVRNGNSASAYASMKCGMLSTDIAMWTGSIGVSQRSEVIAQEAYAGSSARNWGTNTHTASHISMSDGNMRTSQMALADDVLTATQESEANAQEVYAVSSAWDWGTDTYTDSYISMSNGNTRTSQKAIADDGLKATQKSEANAREAYARSSARNEDTDLYSETLMSNGKMWSSQMAVANDGLTATQKSEANAQWARAISSAWNQDAELYSEGSICSGNMQTMQTVVEASDSFTAIQEYKANAHNAYAGSSARSGDTDIHSEISMFNGNMWTSQMVIADDGLTETQESEANAQDARARSYAWNRDTYTDVICNVLDGSFWANLQSYYSDFALRSSGETRIKTGASGQGEAFASAGTFFYYVVDWKSVGPNSELRARMQSEVSNGSPSADVEEL